MTKIVADIMVETLVEAGARRCYGVVGDTLNFFTDALRREGSIRWIHVRHEEAGGFAAGADAQLTGELALCAGSCGPGSLHFINGLAESNRNRAPVVLIASQITRDELGFDFPQEVDYRSVYQSVSVFCEEIRTPEQARRMTAAAAQAAIAKRGVAVLIMPVDVSKAPAPKEPHFRMMRPRTQSRPDDAALREIADALNAGAKISIYAGAGCENAHDEVVALAGKLKAPITHTSRAKDFLSYDNPYNVGMTGLFGNAGGMEAILESDTLLLLGCDFAWRQFYPSTSKIIQIDIDGTHLGRRHPVDIAAVGDVKTTTAALAPLVEEKTDDSYLKAALEKSKKAIAALNSRAAPGEGPIHPQYLTSLISKHAQKNAVLTADGGSPMLWSLRHFEATGENRTIVSLRHGTMANAMPQALGAQAAYPGRQVISLSGDGGLAMLLGDLLTAVQEKLPIKVAVVNNSRLDFVDLEQKVEGLLNTYTDLANPDFSVLAKALGMWGKRVEAPGDLEKAVVEWLAQPGPAILDVKTDPNELVMPPAVAPEQVMGMALYMAKGVLSGRGGDVAALAKSAADTFMNKA